MDSEIFSQLVVTTDSTVLLLLRMCTVVMAMLCTEHTVLIFSPQCLSLASVLRVTNVGVRRPGYEASASYHKHSPCMLSFRLSPTISCGGLRQIPPSHPCINHSSVPSRVVMPSSTSFLAAAGL